MDQVTDPGKVGSTADRRGLRHRVAPSGGRSRLRSRWLIATLALCLSASACTYDWTQFGFGPDGTRSSGDAGISVATVSTLAQQWVGVTGSDVDSSPAVVGGVVYVGSGTGEPTRNARLYAFAASGASCPGAPASCSPLWTATVSGGTWFSSPTVIGGVVYVLDHDGVLYAFDAAGTGCTGTPKTCAPMWRSVLPAPFNVAGFDRPPVVAGGTVYISGDRYFDGLVYGFDAAGSVNCSGAPKQCAPTYQATIPNGTLMAPRVANGIVYVANFQGGNLYAIGAAGSATCPGLPMICEPLWQAPLGSDAILGLPTIAGGLVLLGVHDEQQGGLYAFDAAGVRGCSGTPKSCSPLWIGRSPSYGATWIVGTSSATVSGSTVYIGSGTPFEGGGLGVLLAFDAAGVSGCSGSPKVCAPLWSAPTSELWVTSSPAVAGGVVYVGGSSTLTGALYAFDAAGSVGCSGTPKVCAPLRRIPVGGEVDSSPAVSGGQVFVGADDERLHVYKPVT